MKITIFTFVDSIKKSSIIYYESLVRLSMSTQGKNID